MIETSGPAVRLASIALLAILFSGFSGLIIGIYPAKSYARAPAEGVQTLYSLPHISGQIIVKRTQGSTLSGMLGALERFSPVQVASHTDGLLDLIEISNDDQLQAAIQALLDDPSVEFAEPNYLAQLDNRPNDIDFSRQWSKDNTGLNAPNGLGAAGADLNLVAAWDSSSTAPAVRIAIIDDGFETTHPDLAANAELTGRCFASPSSARPCTRGPADPSPADERDTHGTQVMGTAAAVGNNGIGIAGAIWEVNVLPLKVDLSYFAIVQAIDESILQNADIVNMSFGGPAFSQALSDAIARAELAGILMIASAGNADANNDAAEHYPSDFDQPNLLSVAATNSRDEVSGFSQWGSISVDLAAPGEAILTTTTTSSSSAGYGLASGTSFSAPHVAGVAALIANESPNAGYAQLKAQLLNGAVLGRSTLGDVTPGTSKEHSPGRVATGRLDATAALSPLSGGVLLLDSVSVSDGVSGNRRVDPLESTNLEISLHNSWLSETDVRGMLRVADSNTSISFTDETPVEFGDIAQNSAKSALFAFTAADFSGHEQVLVELALTSAGSTPLPSRYFYVELGALSNGVTLTQQNQRFRWDEFQGFHIDVPPNATNLRVSTAATGDIDLLLRHNETPEYLITLNDTAGGGFYYVDSETLVSSTNSGNEQISISSPVAGSYQLVVVNYDQQPNTYQITASYDAASSGTFSFTNSAISSSESAGELQIDVSRARGTGPLSEPGSVQYELQSRTATVGEDAASATGTLRWDAGESGTKSFAISVIDDNQEEGTETLAVVLSNPVGGSLENSAAELSVTITDNDERQSDTDSGSDSVVDPEVESSSGSGGSTDGFAAFLLLLLLTMRFSEAGLKPAKELS